jgi:phosphatidylserine decarboxylase
VDLIGGTVVRRVVLTLDATMTTTTVLTLAQALEVGQAILDAAR